MMCDNDTGQISDDRKLLEDLRRGLCQEVEALRNQMDGKRKQLAAISRNLDRVKARKDT